MKLLNQLFSRTRFSFWIVYALSRLLSFFYVLRTRKLTKVPQHETLKDVEATLDRLIWNEDSFVVLGFKFKHFWMRGAEEIQWYLENGILPQTDRDEFALYAAKALESVQEAKAPAVLTVRWINANGDVEGHNMALYSYATQNGFRMYGHIGNWGHFRGFNSIAKVVESVGKLVGYKPIAYALATTSLKLIAHEKL